MRKKLLIFGNGAMARCLHSFVKEDIKVSGFTVDDAYVKSDTLCGLPLVPFSRAQQRFNPAEHAILVAVGFVGMNELRIARVNDCLEKGYSLTSFYHNSLVFHEDVVIRENTIIYDHSSIHPGCRIGQSVFISSNVNIGHDCIIGDGAWINSGVSIGGGSEIGECCFLGVNASVAHGVRLAPRTFVGANTLVSSDTEEGSVIVSPMGKVMEADSKRYLAMLGAM